MQRRISDKHRSENIRLPEYQNEVSEGKAQKNLMFGVIYITTSSLKEAGKIAGTLVKEKLAACVNIFPIESVFRWKGKIQKEKEVGMLVKTKAKLTKKVIKRVKKLHSYEIPCIISLPIESGHKKFLEWIDKETM